MANAGVKKIGLLLIILISLWLIAYVLTEYSGKERADTVEVWFFDVGQGDGILINTPASEQIVVDGGPDADIVRMLNRVMPKGDKTIELLILTHNHADHLSGALAVVQHFDIKLVWLSGAIHTSDGYINFLTKIKERGINIDLVSVGDKIEFGQLQGVVLFPLESYNGQLPKNQHDANLVTSWQYGQIKWLLTGDAETPHERQIISAGLLAPHQILKIGHHGSRTSTSVELLNIVKPQLAIIQVGRDNKFNHPHPDVIERLNSYGIKILRNDLDYTIKFSIWPDYFQYQTGIRW